MEFFFNLHISILLLKFDDIYIIIYFNPHDFFGIMLVTIEITGKSPFN